MRGRRHERPARVAAARAARRRCRSIPIWLLVVVLGVTGWFGIARLVRGEVRAIRNADFVLAARALGAPPSPPCGTRHVLPHVLGPVLVASTLAVGQVIVLEAGLSWLGIGVQPPQASWGNIIRDGTEFIASAPWVSIGPGILPRDRGAGRQRAW